MNRRKAREYALQMLFQRDFTGGNAEIEYGKSKSEDKKESAEFMKFAEDLVSGTIAHLQEIDGVIQDAAEHWKMERMSVVDRNIMRFAAYEIIYRKDIPAAVTINEALEIAKKFSSSESVPFINGLLDKIVHDRRKS